MLYESYAETSLRAVRELCGDNPVAGWQGGRWVGEWEGGREGGREGREGGKGQRGGGGEGGEKTLAALP